jgi:hypothetical protein
MRSAATSAPTFPSAPAVEKIVRDYETALPAGAWPNWNSLELVREV